MGHTAWSVANTINRVQSAHVILRANSRNTIRSLFEKKMCVSTLRYNEPTKLLTPKHFQLAALFVEN